MMEDQNATVVRVSKTTIAGNLLLSAVKLAAGLLSHSGAMVSDAVHSASDVFSTIVVLIGARLSAKASDREHPYGHERMECVAAVILSIILLVTGLFIGNEGIQKIVSAQDSVLSVPGFIAVPAAILSIAVKEAMFWYTRYHAQRIGSTALMADAWHHRSDALSSVGALAGIVGARLGLPVLDPLASVVICVFVVKAAADIFRDAIDKMVDHSCDEQTESAIRGCVLRNAGVKAIDLLLTREFGSRIYIELEISVDGTLSLIEAHVIAEQVHDEVEKEFPAVKHVMVHVNPAA